MYDDAYGDGGEGLHAIALAPPEPPVRVRIAGRYWPVDIETLSPHPGAQADRRPLTRAVGESIQPEDLTAIREMNNSPHKFNKPGLTYMASTQSLVPHESRQESLALLALDLEGDVDSVTAQPFTLHFNRSKSPRRHTPDYFARLRSGGRLLIDVKSSSAMEQESVTLQLEVTARICDALGWAYRIFADDATSKQANVLLVTSFRSEPSAFRAVIPAVRVALSEGPIPWAALVERSSRAACVHPALVRPAIFHALWLGLLVVNLDQELTDASLVALRQGEEV